MREPYAVEHTVKLSVEDAMARTWKPMAVAVLVALAGASMLVSAQQPAADLILFNGKIITVDDKFSIAQAVAVRGDRIVAVGTNEEVNQLAGPNTRRIDLEGKSVTPGMIDNHAHFQEEGAYWTEELRLDGIESRAQALEMIRARGVAKGPGEWVYTLGGWAPDQFADDSSHFTREELDEFSPDNPVLLQFTRQRTYLNSLAIDAIGLDARTDPWIVRDAGGRPTGVVLQPGAGSVRNAAGFLKALPPDIFESSSMQMLEDFSRAGLTSSGGSCQYADIYRRWRQEGKMSMRFFCFRTATGGGRSTDEVIAEIPNLRYFDGDEWLDYVNWGERLVGVTDNVTDTEPTVPAETFAEWGRMARAVAKAGITIFIHTTMEWTVEAQLQQVEQIAKEQPIRHLRWAFVHMEQVTPSQIERMRNLGMYIAVHPRAVISGESFNRDHGDRSYAMPPLKAIQDSGIQWGFGTDAFEVNQYRPFTTLWWAVTGKMVGGTVVNHQPISREDALIAHTRKNAYFFFRENDLGSIQTGKLADMAVIDRDYLTVPVDEIKEIESVLTIVGGKVVYEAAAEASTP